MLCSTAYSGDSHILNRNAIKFKTTKYEHLFLKLNLVFETLYEAINTREEICCQKFAVRD